MLKGNIKLEVSKIEDLKSGTPVSITYQTVKR
jgi:hypothetical protein